MSLYRKILDCTIYKSCTIKTQSTFIFQKTKKENIVKLIYCNMLGHDVRFGLIEAIKFAQQQNLLEKRVGEFDRIL